MSTKKSAKPAPAAAADPPPAAGVGAPAPPEIPPGCAGLVVSGNASLDKVKESPLNPRLHFTDEETAALAESLRGKVFPRLIVRPVPLTATLGADGRWAGLDHFEIVDGARRSKAARMLGLAQVPVDIQWLTDDEAERVMLASDVTKVHLRPSERSAALVKLAARRTVEAAAEAAGVVISRARDLLALQKLPPWLVAAVDAGAVPLSTAAIAARIKGETGRRKAAACILLGCYHPANLADKDLAALDAGKTAEDLADDGPLTPLDARDLVKCFQRELKGKPFRKALDLVPTAPGNGTCDECPRRAGNDPEALADGVRADVCLDPDCFQAKAAAWGERAMARFVEGGGERLSQQKAAKLFSSGGRLAYGVAYHAAEDKCPDDPAGRTYGQVLRGKVAPVGVMDLNKEFRELFDKQTAAAALKELGIGTGAAAAGGRAGSDADDAWRKSQRESEHKAKAGKAAGLAANGQVADRMAAAADGSSDQLGLLQHVGAVVADMAGADACRAVAKRRGLDHDPNNCRAAVESLAGRLQSLPEFLGLAAELAAARRSFGWGSMWAGQDSPKERAFWERFGVDPKALQKAALAEQKAGAKAKKGGGTPPGATPRPVPAAKRATTPSAAEIAEEAAHPLSAFAGEFIGALDVTREQLDRASVVAAFVKPPKEPIPVRPFALKGGADLYVTAGSVHRYGHGSYEALRLYDPARFRELHPMRPTTLMPQRAADLTAAEQADGCYCGVRVRVGKTELVIGSKVAARRLTTKEPEATTPPAIDPAAVPAVGDLPLWMVEDVTGSDWSCLQAVGLRTLADLERACGGDLERVPEVLGGWPGVFTAGDVERLAGLITRHLHPPGPKSVPPAAAANPSESAAGGLISGPAAETVPAADAWRSLTLVALNLRPAVEAKLARRGVTTLGDLADELAVGTLGLGPADLRDIDEALTAAGRPPSAAAPDRQTPPPVGAPAPAPPPAIYGYCVTYRARSGEEATCHYVTPSEAKARTRTAHRTDCLDREVIACEPLTEEQYVRAYGRGKS